MLTKSQIKARLGLDTDDALAALFNITPSAVSQWGDRPIPANRWRELKYELRPDVFGDEPKQAA